MGTFSQKAINNVTFATNNVVTFHIDKYGQPVRFYMNMEILLRDKTAKMLGNILIFNLEYS